MCRASEGTDLIVPFGVLEMFEWSMEIGVEPFKVFIALEETGERVRTGALTVSMLWLRLIAGSVWVSLNRWINQFFALYRRKTAEKKPFAFPSSLDLLVICRCMKSHLQPSSLTNDKKTRAFTSRISTNADVPLERRIRRRVYFSSVHRSCRPPGLSVIRMSPLQISKP
jgi:hypothetical protein